MLPSTLEQNPDSSGSSENTQTLHSEESYFSFGQTSHDLKIAISNINISS